MAGTANDSEPAGDIRASDAERDAVVERLKTAAGEGRLTLDEFSGRMGKATSAKTRAELERLMADLPAEAAVPPSAVPGSVKAPASWHVSPVGGLRVHGPWRMERQVIVISLVGGTRLDLTQAQLAAREVTLTKVSIVGSVRVVVPEGVQVDVSRFSLVGSTRVGTGPPPGPGAPTIHIRAFSLVGGVRVYQGARYAGKW